jgi:hypothetical protein
VRFARFPQSLPVLTLLLAACASRSEDAVATPGPQFLAPRALLDRVDRVELAVYAKDPGAAEPPACDEETGVAEIDDREAISKSSLSRDNCEAGHFCGTVRVPADGVARTYVVRGFDADGDLFATGCTIAAPKKDGDLALTIRRRLPEATCPNGTVEAPETCDETGDPLCNSECATGEVLLSTAATGVGPKSGARDSKRDPALLWRAGSGDSGRLWTVFGDTSNASVEAVGLRVLGDNGQPLPTPSYATNSFFLPTTTGETPPNAPAKSQRHPALAALGSTTWIAFDDDATAQNNGRDIRLRGVGADFKTTVDTLINGDAATGESGDQLSPAIAASANALLIAWVDTATSRVFARTVTPVAGNGAPTLGPIRQISEGGTNSNISVARTPTGWIVVWEGGGDIKLRILSDSAVPSGTPVNVNANTDGVQERPSLSVAPDGSFAVSYTDRAAGTADVYVQRYNAAAARVAGDLDAPIHDRSREGDQTDSSVFALADGRGYVVAWADGNTGTVHGRWLKREGGGFLDPVTGLDGEFLISSEEKRTRGSVKIVAGGKRGNVFVAWQDASSAGTTGIVGRRLPPPGAK